MEQSGVDASESSAESNLFKIPQSAFVPLLSPSSEKKRQKTVSQLHLRVSKISKMLAMDDKELRRKRELIKIVTDVSWTLFKKEYPQLEVEPFGGFTNGLGTKGSDVDIVLTGMHYPDDVQGGRPNRFALSRTWFGIGYTDVSKEMVSSCLGELLRRLQLPLKHQRLIRQARIPVLKLTTADGIDLDVSIGNQTGPIAAVFIKRKVEALPVVRPLVRTVKYLLKSVSLNDVATGGLGTYALANMAIAYVQDLQTRGADVSDYGNVLLGFLDFYGNRFDVVRQAVSLRAGNFCLKARLALYGEDPTRYHFYIQDYITGNDVSWSTCKVMEIQMLFSSVYKSLAKHGDAPPLSEQKPLFPFLTRFADAQMPFLHSSPRISTSTFPASICLEAGNTPSLQGHNLNLSAEPRPTEEGNQAERPDSEAMKIQHPRPLSKLEAPDRMSRILPTLILPNGRKMALTGVPSLSQTALSGDADEMPTLQSLLLEDS